MSDYPDYLLLQGDARRLALADKSVHCVVTSPPYYNLRDYQTPGQIGLEESPAAFVAAMVGVFREVKRVLRDDGVCWLNLGDSYAATGKSGGGAQGERWAENGANVVGPRGGKWSPAPSGFKPKDRLGIPHRVVFALQEDGWYWRDEIVWHKPNPMPESVTDRTTKAHEMVFLLTKRERYHYDADAVREGFADNRMGDPGEYASAYRVGSRRMDSNPTCRPTGGQTGRNLRSVWTIASQSCDLAHFATMPPALAERCIKAGCPEGGVVFDPFSGAGTTGLVARRLGRRYVGTDLSLPYLQMSSSRIKKGLRPVSPLDPKKAHPALPGQLPLFGGF